jgi:REP element-mobilizing transposase RayT
MIVSVQRSVTLSTPYDFARGGTVLLVLTAAETAPAFAHTTEQGMQLSTVGQIAMQDWLALPAHFPMVELDVFVLRPNALHAILLAEVPSLKRVVNHFKGEMTTHLKQAQQWTGALWQPSYRAHVIRGERALNYFRSCLHRTSPHG